MLLTTKWIEKHLPNEKGNLFEEIMIEHVTTDSRLQQPNALFVPIVGDLFDGHDFLEQAIDNGAVATLWKKDKELPSFVARDFPVFYVTDTLEGLQYLSHMYRKEINPIVIGITGSNGKTTTKDIVAAVCKKKYKTHYTAGNFNNHIGMPLTILSMPEDTEVLVLEMGMNHFKELELLSNLAEPDYAIITNIGESHIEFLGSRDGITQAKLEIISGLAEEGKLIIDGDEPLLHIHNTFRRTLTCGFQVENDVVISNVHVSQKNTTFELSDQQTYEIPLIGKHHAQNASFAVCLGKLLQIPVDQIKEGLMSLELTAMRFEFLTGKNDAVIINDAYNASPTSLKASIEIVKHLDGFKEKILVLGDIYELGDRSEEMHRSIVPVIDEKITAVLTYGNDSIYIHNAILEQNKPVACTHFTEKDALLNHLERYLVKDNLILFKASRGLAFEHLVKDVLAK